jgi:ATP-dependent Clp protease ATP-binding subunit ClpC
VRAATETAHSLKARLDKGATRAGKSSRELVSRTALQLHLIGEGICDVEENAAVEVVLAIEPAFERQGDAAASVAWCKRLADMYRAWASKRHMQLTEIPDAGGNPLMLLSGFGAARALAREVGLHVLDLDDERATARVRVASAPIEEMPRSRLIQALRANLQGAGQPSTVVRRYRDGASPLVRDLATGWRSGRLDAVLAGDFDLVGAGAEP